jgi:signal transduction histidine kinase/ActR/RegA family two-component response regulator
MGGQTPHDHTPLLPNKVWALVFVFLCTAVVMFIYELTKQLLHPDISIWESHAVTIFFSAVVATAMAHLVLRRQHTMHEALRQSRESFAAITEKNTAGILVVGQNGTVWFSNPAARRQLRLESFHGEPIRLPFGPENPGEVEIIDREGNTGTAEVREMVTEWEGEPARLIMLHDVTAMRDAERRLQQQSQLAAVGRLAAGIAHDLNNMLQSVRLSAEMARRADRIAPAVASHLDTILDQIDRAANLIRQILDFARKSVIKKERLNLADEVGAIVHLLESTIPERVSIRYEVTEDDLTVLADIGQLQQLITNLAVNAADSMADGGSLTISLSRVSFTDRSQTPFEAMISGPWIKLMIQDTGCGMDASVVRRIFEPFFTTKERGQGTGLGLSQVYGIVKQHSGFIDVESEPGVGSLFNVYLPPARRISNIQRPKHAADSALPRGLGELILVVEDDTAILKTATLGLEGLGYRVATATNGESALKYMARRGSDVELVLTDMVMPGMGGLELSHRLMQSSWHPKVLLMTGYPLDADPTTLRDEGVAGWLHKPFSMDELARAVRLSLTGGALPMENLGIDAVR